MRFDDRPTLVDLTNALPQIANQLFKSFGLAFGWLTAVVIAHQTNADRDVVEIITVHVAAIDLATPTIADFDLSVPRRGAIADHEVIREPVGHLADAEVIVLKRLGIALPRAGIVDHDIPPASSLHAGSVDFLSHALGEVFPSGPPRGWGCGLNAALFFKA